MMVSISLRHESCGERARASYMCSNKKKMKKNENFKSKRKCLLVGEIFLFACLSARLSGVE